MDDRSKKGEWSEGAVCCLLDAYGARWNLRSKGNLKVGDWEDVAACVSSRHHSSKAPKTATQCKNKIESLKKRYRSEAVESSSSPGTCSSWPFFSRMDRLLRSSTNAAGMPDDVGNSSFHGIGAVADLENETFIARGDATATPLSFPHIQSCPGNPDCHGCEVLSGEGEADGNRDGDERTGPDKKGVGGREDAQEAESKHEEGSFVLLQRKENSDVSVPIANVRELTARQKKHINNEVAACIKTFAETILKLEHEKIEMYKDAERLRAEAEARRAELELTRTQMIMSAQLEIARVLSGKHFIKKKKKKKDARSNLKNASQCGPVDSLPSQQGNCQPSQADSPAETSVVPPVVFNDDGESSRGL